MAKDSSTTKFISTEEARKTRKWWVVDASGLTLGRLASEVAALIRGKHKVTFSPHVDCGDAVIVLNAAKIRTTGNKLSKKMYYKHTGFIGNLKSISLADQLSKRPEGVVEEAVWGMLPKGVLGKQSMCDRLKVFAGETHTHGCQQPVPFTPKYVRRFEAAV